MPLKTGKNDEARDRSRAALLQAGADLMLEHATRNPFAGLRVRALCARAGYSTGAFYLHWATVQDYYDDLARLLSDDDERAFDAEFAALQQTAGASRDAGPLDAITVLAGRDLQLLLDNELWDAMELMNLTWGRDKSRRPVARGYNLLDHTTGQLYGSVLRHRGREPRPPFTWDSIGTVLQGLIEGIGLRCKVDPPRDPAASDLYSTAVAALLAVLTRPAGDPATARDAIQAIFETTPPAT
jgi:AcrR family transcriptional regulator